jgi:hypothetical protein
VGISMGACDHLEHLGQDYVTMGHDLNLPDGGIPPQ